MTFFSTLFNIKMSLMLAVPVFNETHFQSPDFVEDGTDTERKNGNIKCSKLISLYQLIFYILHAGINKTPFQMVTVHAIYGKRKSRELIRTQGDHFYHIGVFVSYRQNQKAKSNLVQYILMQCGKVLVPIPSHFSKDMFVIAALKNFDYQDRSSTTGMNSNHDTVSTLFQVKPDYTQSKC